jgi:hypothetical protein
VPQLRQFAQQGCLYAILDACDAPLVLPKMNELGEERAVSLFKGSAQQDYWDVAPYLARADVNFLRWVFENLWKEPWGIFALAKMGLPELHAHLRKLLIVEVEGGGNAFLRYYDPRVLPKYLHTCNAMELNLFFGPVRAFAVLQEDNGMICRLLTISTNP